MKEPANCGVQQCVGSGPSSSIVKKFGVGLSCAE